jgi:hypothetical protein
VALIVPSTKGMFSPINKALQWEPTCISLGKDSKVHVAFLDLAMLVGDLSKWPTHLKELVPSYDHYAGYRDVCATEARGIWMSGDTGLQPIVWQVHFDITISSQVVSDTKPLWKSHQFGPRDGSSSTITFYMILQQEVDLRYVQASAFSNNIPTVACVMVQVHHG